MIVISDTTPIISLIKADKLELLRHLYENIIIPEAVYTELTENSRFKEEARIIKACPFLSVMKVQDSLSVDIFRNSTGLDAGESEAIVLYMEQNADVLLMDERKGRRVAKQMGARHIGTVGILLLAYEKKLLSADEVEKCTRSQSPS